jgi:hypothetical protein
MRKFIQEWPPRHQHPVSRVLHAIGIPMTIAAIPLALWQLYESNWPAWWRPVLLFIVGYAIQYIGHKIEGNDMGEIVGIKKRLGKPYVDVSPRYKK